IRTNVRSNCVIFSILAVQSIDRGPVTTTILASLIFSNVAFAETPIKIVFHKKEIRSDVSPQNTVYIMDKEPIPQLVAALPAAGANLYAVIKDGYFTNFELKVKNGTRHFPYWRSSINREIDLYYSDINQDGVNELIIILTTGAGSGVSEKEVHVFNLGRSTPGEFLNESYVDNPIIVAMKNVKTKLTAANAEITIGKKRTVVNIEKSGINPSHLFKDIAYGSIIEYEIRNGELTAILPTLITPGGESVGSIIITYEYKDKMYQDKNVIFVPN
ncbi:hypothetical protein ACTHSJ_33395, partial [Paenibacillus cellulositrophicus]|uniref:hypothetical protein n=1 Tax=Paenibacillus cellulositrophicus TaxID=562959 RepID=UPI003F7D4F2E